MGITDLWTFFNQWGPVFGLVVVTLIFFLWKDWKRENRLQDRVEALEKEHKEIILPLLEKCVTAITQNTIIMGRVETVVNRCVFACRFSQESQRETDHDLLEQIHDTLDAK
jgi:heme/copper-type cytochrome/quinol oxidase subunit 2